MTAPNAAVDALPGWRGTDPDGGTWVRLMDAGAIDLVPVWRYVSPSGGSDYRRTQEEAEAAGLVAVIPAPDGMGLSIDLGETWGVWGCNTLVEVLTELGVEPGTDLGDVVKMVAEREAAPLIAAVSAPAPLDPGNPEHLRQVVKFVMSCYIGEDDDVIAEQIRALATSLHSRADRLDRERAEAEQDAADRKRAEEIVRRWEIDESAHDAHVEFVLAGIRAERARLEVAK